MSAALPGLSRSRAAKLIEQGRVLVSGQPARAAQRLRGGEQVSVEIPPPEPTTLEAEALPLKVLHEDRDVVVLDKAAGMVVHPAAGNWRGTLVNALMHHVTDLEGVGGELRPGLVHRLDKDTTGCLVVAKNEPALTALQAAFKGRDVEKVYLALVQGSPPDSGRIETLYGRHPRDRKRFSSKVKEGKPAVTEYRVAERFGGAALLEVTLHTGRTHQIRVHLADAGWPLLGDPTYGRTPPKGPLLDATRAIGRQALHAWRLSFTHPRTGERLRFEAPIPEDLQAALSALRG